MRIRSLGLCGLLAAIFLLCAGWTLAAENDPQLLRNLESQCETRRAELQDLTIVSDFVAHAPDGDISSIHTLRQKGYHVRMDVAHRVAAGEDGMRLDMVGITDTSNSWTMSRGGGMRKAEGNAINQQEPNFVCWQLAPETSRLIGEEMLRGRDCYVIEVQVRYVTKKLWIDRESHLVIQHEEPGPSGSTMQWRASDYHTVIGDLKIPQKIEMFLGTSCMATVIVQSVTFNTGLSDDLFNPDKITFDSPAH